MLENDYMYFHRKDTFTYKIIHLYQLSLSISLIRVGE